MPSDEKHPQTDQTALSDSTSENSASSTTRPSSNAASESSNSTVPKPPGIFGIIQSVLAAMFGVQSEEKRVQDFESGHIGSYIFVGVLFVIIFILTLVAIVNAILE